MSMRIKRDITWPDEGYADISNADEEEECLDPYVEIEITQDVVNQLMTLNKAVKELGVFKIVKSTGDEVWKGLLLGGRKPLPAEECQLHVTSTYFMWTAYIERTDIRMSTEFLYVDELLEMWCGGKPCPD